MRTVSARQVQRLFAEYGAAAWLELPLRYGATFRMPNMVASCDPAVAEQLLTVRAHTARRSWPHRLISALTPGSRGLLFMAGQAWRLRARAVAPSFTRRRVNRFARLIWSTVEATAAEWAKQGELPDLFAAVTRLGLLHVVRIGYGLEAADPVVAEMGRVLIDYKQDTMSPDPRRRGDLPAFTVDKIRDVPQLLAGGFRLARLVRRLRRLVGRLPQGCPARLADPDSWLERLSELLPPDELTDELNHLYGAYAASDYVVTAGLLELSRHPEWRERLRGEARAMGASGVAGRADFARLPCTVAFMREVLRCYPVAMMIYRETGEPLDVGGETLPAGSQVALLPYALQRHPDFWPNGDAFDPGRWLDGSPLPAPFTWIPFLEGPRKCLGRDLAELVFVATLAAISADFDLEVTDASARVLPFVVPRFDRPLPFRVRAAG